MTAIRSQEVDTDPHEVGDIQENENTRRRSQSIVNSSIFRQGGNAQAESGWNNSALTQSPVLKSIDIKTFADYSLAAGKNRDELAIQQHRHEYKHPECRAYSSCDITMETENPAKNNSMAMNNRIGNEEDVVITEYDSSTPLSFSSHGRLTENFHSLTLVEEKENKTEVKKDLYKQRSFENSVVVAASSAAAVSATNRTRNNLEWRSIENKEEELGDIKGVQRNISGGKELPSNKYLTEKRFSYLAANKELPTSQSVPGLHNCNNKKRSITRKKTQSKSSAMEYGEFDHAIIKDNDSERASTDDGYETARTYGSDLTASNTSGDFNHRNVPGNYNLYNKQHQQLFATENQLFGEELTTNNHPYNQPLTSNNHPYNQRLAMDNHPDNQPLTTNNHPYNQRLAMDNHPDKQLLTTNNHPYNQPLTMENHPYNQSPTTQNHHFNQPLTMDNQPSTTNKKPSSTRKVQSLSNLHEILNLECADERKQQEEETIREQTKKEEEQELEQGRKQIHQKLDSMLKARVKTMNASDRAFAKRQMKFPDPLLVNEPPLIIDKDPSLQNMESVEQMSRQRSSPNLHQYRGNNNSDDQGFTNYRSHHSDYVDSSSPYSNQNGRNDTINRGSGQQPQRQIDASFNDSKQSSFTSSRNPTPTATTSTTDINGKLFHLRDKESTELKKKQSMLHELRQAMFQRSRPGSPSSGHTVDELNKEKNHNKSHSPITFEHEGFAAKNHYHCSTEEMQSGEENVAAGFNNGFSDSNFGYNSTGETDLYNSFPLPFPSKTNKSKDVSSTITDTEEKLTDETPINKNQIMTMLNSHIKEKTRLDSVSGKTDLTFRSPKIASQSFALTSRDIDNEEQTESGISEISGNHQLPPPNIFVTEFHSPETQQSHRAFQTEGVNYRPELQRMNDQTDSSNHNIHSPHVGQKNNNNNVSRVESFSSTWVEAPESRAVSRNASFMSEYDAQKSTSYGRNRAYSSTVPDEKDGTAISRNESFSQLSSYGNVSRVESFSSTYVEAPGSRAVSRNASFMSEYDAQESTSYDRNHTYSSTDGNDGTAISRNESFSQISSYGKSRSSTITNDDSAAAILSNESFSSDRGTQLSSYGRSRSNTFNDSYNKEGLSRNQSFSSESRSRSSSILDSALRYEQSQKNKAFISGNLANDSPSRDAITQNDGSAQPNIGFSSSNLSTNLPSIQDTITHNDILTTNDRSAYQSEVERPPTTHVPLVAVDSRGLNLHQTEYYHPSENEEKVIKPSEYKVHRFNDRHRANNIVVDTNNCPETQTSRIVMLEDKLQQPPVMSGRNGRSHAVNSHVPTEEGPTHLSLNDLKRKRQQERMIKSKRLSSSEPLLLDKIGRTTQEDEQRKSVPTTEAEQRQQRSGLAPLVSTARETRGSHALSSNYNNTLSRRKKKIEKSSNEIYTNINVGKINIPDSFQHEINPEHKNSGVNEDIYNDRKHKREQQQQQTSNSSTPRASTPKKLRRRFSLTSIVSGSSTPRSDVTELTNVSSSSSSRRPSSPSLGRRIKNMFSPRSKRKQKHANTNSNFIDNDNDDVSMDTVDDDIMRRLNMNVNPAALTAENQQQNGSFIISPPSLNGSLGDLVNGYSTIKSESGLSMTLAEDEDFGIDDSFLSHQEWMNSHHGSVSHTSTKVSKRPSIKQAMMPGATNKNKNNNNIDSWKAKHNIGKVTVPEVFSSLSPTSQNNQDTRIDNDNNNKYSQDTTQFSSKFRQARSPVLTRKSGGRKQKNDVVITSFDVAE